LCGGGYESGQGSQSGPSFGRRSGQKLIEYQWPGLPGATDPATGKPVNWDLRAPRDTNYYPSDHGDTTHTDYWVAWNPRTINGKLEGRWASDYIYAGCIVAPEGVYWWAWQGTGPLDYANQIPTFGWTQQVSQYRYDPVNFKFAEYKLMGPEVGQFPVVGQEIGPDGTIYLAVLNRWWQQGTTDLWRDLAILAYK
jgi:hypothetical protein